MKRKPSRQTSLRKCPDVLDRAELVLACEHIAALAALLEDYQPEGVVLINGGALHRYVGRLLAAQTRRMFRALGSRTHPPYCRT